MRLDGEYNPNRERCSTCGGVHTREQDECEYEGPEHDDQMANELELAPEPYEPNPYDGTYSEE